MILSGGKGNELWAGVEKSFLITSCAQGWRDTERAELVRFVSVEINRAC